MNRKLSSYVTSQRFSVIRDMVARAKAYENVISLSIGEPDFDTPAFVCEAAMKDTLKGYTHYAASNGDPELRAALLKDIHAWNKDPNGTGNVGHCFIAIDPRHINPGFDVAARAEEMIAQLKDARKAPSVEKIFFPGEMI